jgi:hypothetical protein
MIFSEKSIEAILAGKKTMTRRLVKEGEFIAHALVDFQHEAEVLKPSGWWVTKKAKAKFKKIKPTQVCTVTEKIKWQVGKDYAVQLKRGGQGIWYCPKCKNILTEEQTKIFKKFAPLAKGFTRSFTNFMADNGMPCPKCKDIRIITHPLRIRITNIRKGTLYNIDEKDAKKEGFENKQDFWNAFCKINRIKQDSKGIPLENKTVWVLDFEIAKNQAGGKRK